MKAIKSMLAAVVAALALLTVTAVPAYAGPLTTMYSYGGNKATTHEWWTALGYDGHVQAAASTPSGPGRTNWTTWGRVTYSRNGAQVAKAQTVTACSSTSATHSASVSVWDSLNPWAAKTVANYNFSYISSRNLRAC